MMDRGKIISSFKRHSKMLFKVYKTIDDKVTLMKVQHMVARTAGFNSWSDLINSSNKELEKAKNIVFEDKE